MDGGSGVSGTRDSTPAGQAWRVRRVSRSAGAAPQAIAGIAWNSATVLAPSGGIRACGGGAQRGGGDTDRVGQDAVLQLASVAAIDWRSGRTRDVLVPHQGAGRGSTGR